MIAFAVIRKVKLLLAAGELSQRAIARHTRISRGTVGGVATGKRPDYEALAAAGSMQPAARPDGPAERCPGCGGLVYMPCRVCAARSGEPAPRIPSSANPTGLAIELHGEDRERYERLHGLKRAAAQPAPIDPAWDRPLEDVDSDDQLSMPIDDEALLDALDPIGDDDFPDPSPLTTA